MEMQIAGQPGSGRKNGVRPGIRRRKWRLQPVERNPRHSGSRNFEATRADAMGKLGAGMLSPCPSIKQAGKVFQEKMETISSREMLSM